MILKDFHFEFFLSKNGDFEGLKIVILKDFLPKNCDSACTNGWKRIRQLPFRVVQAAQKNSRVILLGFLG